MREDRGGSSRAVVGRTDAGEEQTEEEGKPALWIGEQIAAQKKQ